MLRRYLRRFFCWLLGLAALTRRDVLLSKEERAQIHQDRFREAQRRGATWSPATDLESFEEAFAIPSSGCRRQCACGREFYNPDPSSWDFEEGELEALAASEATALGWSVQALYLEGAEYVIDCDCWRPKAARVVAWLRQHDREVAAFLTEEKRRRERAAETSPVVEEQAIA